MGAWAPRVEWSPRPRASGFCAPSEGNWGASRVSALHTLQARTTPLGEEQVAAGKRVAVLGLFCDLGLPAGSRLQSRPRPQPLCIWWWGARGTWVCGGFVGRTRGCSRWGGGRGFWPVSPAGGGRGDSAGGRGKGHVGGGCAELWSAVSRLGVRIMTGACSVACVNRAPCLSEFGLVL